MGVFTGRLWARVVGTIVALCSALVSLTFLSAKPFAAVVMITLAVVVILALTVHGADIQAAS